MSTKSDANLGSILQEHFSERLREMFGAHFDIHPSQSTIPNYQFGINLYNYDKDIAIYTYFHPQKITINYVNYYWHKESTHTIKYDSYSEESLNDATGKIISHICNYI